MIVKLSKKDFNEVQHKLEILRDEPDLREDYGITLYQAAELVDSIPQKGGQWEIPGWAVQAVRSEMENHCLIMETGYADGAKADGDNKQYRRIMDQMKRLAKAFDVYQWEEY